MRVVVTGSSGFIGAALVERLEASGHSVERVDGGDAIKPTDVCDWKPSGPFDVVYHLASHASPGKCAEFPLDTIRVNTEGTARVLRWAHFYGARAILASTSEVYGPSPVEHPQREQTPCLTDPNGPRSCYVESKRCLEAYAQQYRELGAEVVTVRLFNVYGPGMATDNALVIPCFLSRVKQGLPLTVMGDGSQSRTFCYIDDATDALERLCDSSFSGVMNIGSTEQTSIRDLALMVADPQSVRFGEARNGDPVRRCPDIGLARSVLSWLPGVSLKEGLRRCADAQN